MLLALVTLWALTVIPSRRLRLTAAIGLVLFGAIVAGRLSAKELQRYESIVTADTYSREESTRGRLKGYVVGGRIFQQRPVFGIGLGNWSAYREARIDGDKLMPHTLGGQLVGELGLAGTLAFLGFVTVAFRFAVRHRRRLRDTQDPWDQAVHRLLGAMVVLLALLLVSGLAAHNVGREAWFLAPALMIAAVRCRPEAQEESARVS